MALWVVLLPLIGFLLAGTTVRFISPRIAQIVTVLPMIGSAVLAGMVFNDVVMNKHAFVQDIAPWISVGNLNIHWALHLDALTAVMLIVVTWVSTVVHIYSVGYMSHDPHPQRFMAYLSLFTFCMLMLVTADNFIQLFLGWEGVGLASYLLIGFWFKRESANAASMKAFIVNRVGDFGMVLGILLIYLTFGTLTFGDVFAAAGSSAYLTHTTFFLGHEWHTITLICLLLFIGCMGKSAQFGLHTWLPDAMEGPTPVSALIHAATMVTAGVFLVARCSPLFELSPEALVVVTVVGGFTALFAATVGMVQTDIKRVIAYSTCSQLGYMFFACGVGAYAAGIFHLVTHAFFKALLFLCAGSVIHGMHDEQDMTRMGGLAPKMKITYAFMLIGSLALMGVPPLAGYYSKDVILQSAFAVHTDAGEFAFVFGFIASILTAFYSFRLLFLTFHGQERGDKKVHKHAHEAPAIMWAPLLLLVAGSLGAGYVGVHYFDVLSQELNFWNGAIKIGPHNEVLELAHGHPVAWWVTKLPILFALLAAYYLYLKSPAAADKLKLALRPIHQFLWRKWYIDELYDAVFVKPALALGRRFWQLVDVRIIDGLGPNGLARLTQYAANRLSGLQSGYLFHYALAMMLGIFALLAFTLLR
ncbi:NADH-quinone oxidoreductase subunit L [bacterium]|nr:NADH-quinone oxidoreductase subunit L [bacterium]